MPLPTRSPARRPRNVLGDDTAGEGALNYTWTVTSQPASATTPTFTFSGGILNGSNGAKNATATFYLAGTYIFQATVTDRNNLIAVSSVTVIVNQALASISLSPATVTLAPKSQQQFQATALDQFGQKLATQPTKYTWSLASGGVGSINTSGLYTAPSSGTGKATVQATASGMTGTAAVTVTALRPSSPRPPRPIRIQ